MNAGKLLAFGAAGVAAWWFFFRSPSPAAAPAPAATPAAGGSSSASASSPVSGKTLDSVYQAMLIKSNGAKSGSVDDWNSWLMQGTPAIVAPDPLPIFQAATPGFDRSTQLTAAQYWAVMSPALKTQFGLTGLGFYGSVFQGARPRAAVMRRRA